MTIQEILEVHVVEVRRNVFTREEWLRCKCGWISARVLAEGFDWEPAKRDHVAEVLEKHMQEREAEAVRASARYIERLYTLNGPINKADVLADLEIAADRLSRGLHAN